MRVGADAGALRRYVRVGHEASARLRATEGLLASITVPGGAELVASVAALARAEEGTDRWVEATARAFVAADHGGRASAAVVALGILTGGSLDRRGSHSPPGSSRVVGRGPAGTPLTIRYAVVLARIARAAEAEADPVRRAHLRALLAPDRRTGRPRHFLDFDGRGDGRVVEVLGDLDRADDVAVVVPGMGEDLDTFDRRVRRRSRRVLDASASASAPGHEVAVIAWLGYDAPDGSPAGLGDAARTGPARAGGAALASLIAGLRLRPDQRLTLIGHSYGSTTVAAAVLDGVHPDAVVALGSPGMLVDRAADFHRPRAGFFTLAARGDVVADLGWFGADPNRPGSGFTPLATSGTGHGSYFAPGSTSLHNVAAVVIGGRPNSADAGRDRIQDLADDAATALGRLVERLEGPG